MKSSLVAGEGKHILNAQGLTSIFNLVVYTIFFNPAFQNHRSILKLMGDNQNWSSMGKNNCR